MAIQLFFTILCCLYHFTLIPFHCHTHATVLIGVWCVRRTYCIFVDLKYSYTTENNPYSFHSHQR